MTITLGPIIGHTTDSTAKIWMRGEKNGGQVCYGRVSILENSNHVQSRYLRLQEHFDYTGVVTVDGLKPSTVYQVQIDTHYLGPNDPIPDIHNPVPGPFTDIKDPTPTDFRTAPRKNNRTLSFVFGSCRYNYLWGNGGRGDKTFRSILGQHKSSALDFVLMVGDQIYADPLNFLNESNTVDDFRKKYVDYFGEPHIRTLMASVPTYMILDDHEIHDNFSRDDLPKYQARFQAALQSYHSYQHLHNPNTPNGVFWYSFDVGDFPFFVTDTRTQRINTAAEGESRTILGFEQFNALLNWLNRNKNKKRKFIVSSVPFFPDLRKGKDKWSGFETERSRLLEFIRLNEISGIVFLSGDVHNTNFARMKCIQDEEFSITSLVSSPFYWPYPHESKRAFFQNRMLDYSQWADKSMISMDQFSYLYNAEAFIGDESFVRVDIDFSGPNPKCEARIFDRKGKIFAGYKQAFKF